MELLYPGDFAGGNSDHNFASRAKLPAVLSGQADRPKTQGLGGSRSEDDVLRVSGSADCQEEVTGFAEGDDLLGKGVFGLVVIHECCCKADHGRRERAGRAPCKLLARSGSKLFCQ